MQRVLITGSSGFIGSHLAEFLIRKGYQVFGTFHRRPFSLKGVTPVQCDFRSRRSVQRTLLKSRPHLIFHLAAQSHIPSSWERLEETFQVNVFGTYYLLESVREMKLKSRVVVTGSSSEYGPVSNKGILLREDSPFRPTNPYALSKVGEDLLGSLYFHTFGLPVVRIIPFYVIGPRKEPDAPSDFAKAIAGHRRGKVRALSVGNLKALRDVVDIRDAVRAFFLIARKGRPGRSYNLCTGRETSLEKILKGMLKISNSKIPVAANPQKLRRGDETRIVGDPTELRKFGWRPRFHLDETLASILDYWSEQTKG